MRRDHVPDSMCRSVSGLPIPVVGSRSMSSMSRLMRVTIARSVRCQWVESSHPIGVKPASPVQLVGFALAGQSLLQTLQPAGVGRWTSVCGS
jgi:hypothetical protein